MTPRHPIATLVALKRTWLDAQRVVTTHHGPENSEAFDEPLRTELNGRQSPRPQAVPRLGIAAEPQLRPERSTPQCRREASDGRRR